MAASLRARLLRRGARSSLPPPSKVCGALRWRQKPTPALGSVNAKPRASWRSLWNPSRGVRRAVPAQSCLRWFSIYRRRVGSVSPAGEAKGSAFRDRPAALSHRWETEILPERRTKRRPPDSFEDPAEEPAARTQGEPRGVRQDWRIMDLTQFPKSLKWSSTQEAFEGPT